MKAIGYADGMNRSEIAAAYKETEAKEIEWLKTGPAACVLYAHPSQPYTLRYMKGWVSTWLDTKIADAAFGPRVYHRVGINTSYRRSVSCLIFGVRYHGWYMESSGDYVRLRRAKKQGKQVLV